jgi:hypothetical protein
MNILVSSQEEKGRMERNEIKRNKRRLRALSLVGHCMDFCFHSEGHGAPEKT